MAVSALFLLPGEIRNHIFEMCIAHSKNTSMKKHKFVTQQNATQGRPPYVRSGIISQLVKGVEVAVLPRWQGHAQITTLGLRNLPLLLVNKQIHSEICSLVDSLVSEVTIGPYGVQFSNEDPNVRWEMAYELLLRRPYLLKNVKHVKISLPWLRTDT